MTVQSYRENYLLSLKLHRTASTNKHNYYLAYVCLYELVEIILKKNSILNLNF